MPGRLKPGVNLVGITGPMVVGDSIVAGVFEQFAVDCVRTSVNDGKHGLNSLHAVGQAVDYRTKIVARDALEAVVDAIRQRLGGVGGQFDVILEDRNGPNEHLHVEFQPHRVGS